MRWLKAAIVFSAVLTGMALLKPTSSNEESIYQSLDTLAEIFALASAHGSPDLDNEAMVEGAISGLLEQLDPHSNYYDANRYETMREDQKGTFSGIGILVGFQEDQLTVVSPLAGAPAAQAGIRAGDIIFKIDGHLTADLDTFEAIRMLRGLEGTPVSVSVKREGLEDLLEFELIRAEIPSNNVRTSFMVDEKTGYIALKDFGETASQEVADAMQRLSELGMRQVILDLRGNPGGLLPQAIEVAGLFMPGEKLVVSTQGRLKNANQKFYSQKSSPVEQVPLIVAIDRGSASASEIVAGAIQDHDRGLILGVNSWGKGLVQSVFPLVGGSKGLALTTARYYTPSGRNIQGDYHSLDDYYNPGSSAEQFFESGKATGKIFKTTLGREVLEARGITPDVYISFPEVPEVVSRLEGRFGAFFKFAATVQDKYPVQADWEADDTVIEDFRRYLTDKEIATEGFAAATKEIREKLTYQMLHIADPEWAWYYLIKQDHQVQTALSLFPQAERLFDVYRGQASLPTDYSRALKKFSRLNQPEKLAEKAP